MDRSQQGTPRGVTHGDLEAVGLGRPEFQSCLTPAAQRGGSPHDTHLIDEATEAQEELSNTPKAPQPKSGGPGSKPPSLGSNSIFCASR